MILGSLPYSLDSFFCYQSIASNVYNPPPPCFSSPRITYVLPFYLPWAASENLLLLVASQNKIIADNITSHVHNIFSLVENGSYVIALDFDSVSNRIFWSDSVQGKTWSAFQNGTDWRIVSTFCRPCDCSFLPFGLFGVTTERWPTLLILESSSFF